jgi:hypothetical protein
MQRAIRFITLVSFPVSVSVIFIALVSVSVIFIALVSVSVIFIALVYVPGSPATKNTRAGKNGNGGNGGNGGGVKTCPGFPGYCSESYPGDTCLVVCAFGRNNVPECQVIVSLHVYVEMCATCMYICN